MFLKNLDALIAERKINKNILAKESGIPYTTIDGFYKKGWDNVKLSTLLKLAEYFDVSLDWLVLGDEAAEVGAASGDACTLSDEEKAKLQHLPTSLEEALDALEADHDYLTAGGVFPEELLKNFIKAKREECSEMSKIPHPAEFDKYYNL